MQIGMCLLYRYVYRILECYYAMILHCWQMLLCGNEKQSFNRIIFINYLYLYLVLNKTINSWCLKFNIFTKVFLLGTITRFFCKHIGSYVGIPITTILWQQIICYQQNHVNNPPGANTAHCQKFAYSGASLAQAEAIHAQKSKQHAVYQCCYKVVIRIAYARFTVPKKGPCTIAIDIGVYCTLDFCVLYAFVEGATKAQTSIALLLVCRCVITMIDGFLAFQKISGQKRAHHIRSQRIKCRVWWRWRRRWWCWWTWANLRLSLYRYHRLHRCAGSNSLGLFLITARLYGDSDRVVE